MQRTLHWMPLLAAVLLLAAPAAAQDEHPSFQALQRAIVLEEAGRDPAAAQALYRALAADQQAAPSARTEAALRLGLLLHRMGDEEAAREALGRAAAGEGGAAARARALLRGEPSPQEAGAAAQVAVAARRLQAASLEEAKAAADHLVWMGDAAVPHLVRILEDRDAAFAGAGADLDFVTRLAHVLARIGGREAEAFLRRAAASEDLLYRRAVVRGLTQWGLEKLPAAQVGLRALLTDRDPRIRSQALGAVGHGMTLEEIAAQVADPDPEVLKAVLPVAGALLGRLVETSPEALEPFLDLLGRFQPPAQWGWSLGRLAPPPPPPERLVVMGRHLASMQASLQEGEMVSRRQDTLASLIQVALGSWATDAVPSVLELVELGYDRRKPAKGKLAVWLMAHAGPDHAPRIADLAAEVAEPLPLVEWLLEHGARELALQAAREVLGEGTGEGIGGPERWAPLCARIGLPEADRLAVELVRRSRNREAYGRVARALEAEDRPIAAEVFVDLVRMEVAGVDRDRNLLLKAMMVRGLPEALDVLPQAYRLGLEAVRDQLRGTPARGTRIGAVTAGSHAGPVRGLLWLVTVQDPPDQGFLHSYAPEDLAKAFDRCLAPDGPVEAWEDALMAIERAEGPASGVERPEQATRTFTFLPPAAVEVLCRKAMAWLRIRGQDVRPRVLGHLVRGWGLRVPAVVDLARRTLQAPEPEIVHAALSGIRASATVWRPMPDDILAIVRDLCTHRTWRVEEMAAQVLASALGGEAVPDLRSLLESRHPEVRSRASALLADLAPDEAAEWILPLLADAHFSVRRAVCGTLGRLRATEAIPHLMDLLKDGYAGVRKAAAEALEEIAFYVEQQQRWKRLQGEKESPAATAAEALLRQAAPQRPRDVRLAAIASLGVLAVPETLPFLIQLMEDPDQEVAAAAAAAVARIHR